MFFVPCEAISIAHNSCSSFHAKQSRDEPTNPRAKTSTINLCGAGPGGIGHPRPDQACPLVLAELPLGTPTVDLDPPVLVDEDVTIVDLGPLTPADLPSDTPTVDLVDLGPDTDVD